MRGARTSSGMGGVGTGPLVPAALPSRDKAAPAKDAVATTAPSAAAEPSRALLQRTLLERYHALRERLGRRLGALDLASDALHEVWLRLQTKDDLPPVANPEAYLFNAAVNTAKNLRRAATGRNRLLPTDLATLAGIPDDGPDPATIAAARAAIVVLKDALAELPLRQQEVFQESFIGDARQEDLARRFNVTVRTIQNDLRHAVEHCARRLRSRIYFVPGQPRLSGKREGPAS